jgi:hypothetical protein
VAGISVIVVLIRVSRPNPNGTIHMSAVLLAMSVWIQMNPSHLMPQSIVSSASLFFWVMADAIMMMNTTEKSVVGI